MFCVLCFSNTAHDCMFFEVHKVSMSVASFLRRGVGFRFSVIKLLGAGLHFVVSVCEALYPKPENSALVVKCQREPLQWHRTADTLHARCFPRKREDTLTVTVCPTQTHTRSNLPWHLWRKWIANCHFTSIFLFFVFPHTHTHRMCTFTCLCFQVV